MAGKQDQLSKPFLREKYRGSFLGVLLGDCIGALYERPTKFLPFVPIPEIEAAIASHAEQPIPQLTYTDDTSMTLSLSQSLLKNRGLDPKELAMQFVSRFRMETTKQRLYAKVREEVFERWEATNFEGDIFEPAKLRFHGAGSNGNGGGMRAAAVALFCGNDLEKLLRIAKRNTELTHAHPEGYNGAILQAYAVHLALLDNWRDFVERKFMENLLDFCASRLESLCEDKPFTKRLQIVRDFLAREFVPSSEVIAQLRHSVRAIDAIPMAIYCALRALKPIPDIESDEPFRRIIIYAVSMGGDTDTIASMAGAITGALLGDSAVPQSWRAMCESVEEVLATADALYENQSVCTNSA